MKTLLYKQLKLVVHPMTLVFSFFACMLLIPSYPYSVSFFYVTLGIFFMYQNAQEQRDSAFNALLPVRKADTVKASILFCGGLEGANLLLCIPFMLLSQRINPNGSNLAGIDANPVLLALGLLLFGLFNRLFFPAYYKKGFGVGRAYLKAALALLPLVMADVLLPHVWQFADGYASTQWWLLLPALLLYTLLTLRAVSRSVLLYDKVDI